DLAREVLENILRLLELPGKVVLSDEFTVKDAQGNFVSLGLNIEGDDLGILIGRRGQTMGYLQYVLRLIMAHRMDIRIPIIVDVENYRQRRCESLRILANRIAEQVRVRKVPFSMEPMPPFERRVIHLALANHPDVTTQSVGAGEARKVVIVPKKLPGY
ncbi:MAG: KH domain-containing protein, partial [Dehalococcoidales bacterium]|nr:KH domain-containing protein [Dehalococcoidales bacterium]